MKKIFFPLLAILLLLSGWRYTYNINCFALIFALFIVIVIASSFIEKVMVERRCFSDCYFKENSIFAKILKSKIFITIFYIVYSLIITLTLLYQILDIEDKFLPYLLIYMIFAIVIFFTLKWMLKSSIKDDKLNILSKEMSIDIANVILIAIYIYILYNSYEPSYLKDSLAKTIFYATNSIGSECSYVDFVLRLHREVDSSFWFLINQISDELNQKILNSIIWLTFIFINSLAIVGLNRFLLQVTSIIDRYLSE